MEAPKLEELKSARKKEANVILRLSKNMIGINKTSFPHNLPLDRFFKLFIGKYKIIKNSSIQYNTVKWISNQTSWTIIRQE